MHAPFLNVRQFLINCDLIIASVSYETTKAVIMFRFAEVAQVFLFVLKIILR